MVIDALTPDEIEKHRRFIEKIKRKLFARHSPCECGVIPGSEIILQATAERRWCAGVGEYRRVSLGGLRFQIDSNSARLTLTITHVERDVFIIHAASQRGHTELNCLARIDHLDVLVWQYVCRRKRERD